MSLSLASLRAAAAEVLGSHCPVVWQAASSSTRTTATGAPVSARWRQRCGWKAMCDISPMPMIGGGPSGASQDLFDGLDQRRARHRLFQHCFGAELARPVQADVGAGDGDDANARPLRGELADELEAVHLRHHQVGDGEIDRVLAEELQ